MVNGPRPAVYLDASALVKLIITEPESNALRRHLGHAATMVSCRVAEVELRRVTGRQREQTADETVDEVLEGTTFIELDQAIAQSAGMIGPRTLRSLDAIHLASALSIADELKAFITYDVRLADAARAAGLAVVVPA